MVKISRQDINYLFLQSHSYGTKIYDSQRIFVSIVVATIIVGKNCNYDKKIVIMTKMGKPCGKYMTVVYTIYIIMHKTLLFLFFFFLLLSFLVSLPLVGLGVVSRGSWYAQGDLHPGHSRLVAREANLLRKVEEGRGVE